MEMEVEKLKKKHELYDFYIDSWNFYGLSYEGGRPFIKFALQRHPRETVMNYNQRVHEGINFNYSSSIVDLFNFYLTEKEPIRVLDGLEEDPLWKMFEKDSDLKGTDFNIFMDESQKIASIYGTVGILVNKPAASSNNRQSQIDNKIYPYCVSYTPQNILDWKFEINIETHRPFLSYLKLKEKDYKYMIWTQDTWEIWLYDPNKVGKPVRLQSGTNNLGIIPFLWMPNIKDIINPYIGESDIKEISLIVASITRNISQGDEVIKYSGFPMLRKPMRKADDPTEEDVVGEQAVLEFDPSMGDNGKPDWLESEIMEPIEGILKWTDRKADEIFRISHLSGVHGQRKSNNEVASGMALRYEFQQLNSVLGQKGNNMDEGEMKIIKLWLKWQNETKEINVRREKSFSVDDLTISLDNIFKTMDKTVSDTFYKKAQEEAAKITLPDLSDEDHEIIKKEIEVAEVPDLDERDGTKSETETEPK